MLVVVGVSSGVASVSQFRSFSLSERDKIRRFFEVDELPAGLTVASLPSEGSWVSADVLVLPLEF